MTRPERKRNPLSQSTTFAVFTCEKSDLDAPETLLAKVWSVTQSNTHTASGKDPSADTGNAMLALPPADDMGKKGGNGNANGKEGQPEPSLLGEIAHCM